jgi:hypothetical protein
MHPANRCLACPWPSRQHGDASESGILPIVITAPCSWQSSPEGPLARSNRSNYRHPRADQLSSRVAVRAVQLFPTKAAEAPMSDYFSIDDMSAADMKAILSADLEQLDDDQVLAIKDFVIRVGGLRNARIAVEMLRQLEDAA